MASRMIISLSASSEEVCLAASPFVGGSSAVGCQMLGALRVIAGPSWCSRLCLCTHTHITHLHVKVEAFTCGYAHTCMHSHFHQTHTLPPFPPADVLLCGLVTPFIPGSRWAMCPGYDCSHLVNVCLRARAHQQV